MAGEKEVLVRARVEVELLRRRASGRDEIKRERGTEARVAASEMRSRAHVLPVRSCDVRVRV